MSGKIFNLLKVFFIGGKTQHLAGLQQQRIQAVGFGNRYFISAQQVVKGIRFRPC